jgi:hypothetical protein
MVIRRSKPIVRKPGSKSSRFCPRMERREASAKGHDAGDVGVGPALTCLACNIFM